MAINMTALINQELAKIEKRNRAYGSSADPAMDAFSEAWKMGQEQKVWNERKNLQRQQMMSEFAKDTSRLYNNEDAKIYKDRFQKYFDRHKDSMDESTLEMGQMYLSNFDFQMKKNDSFNQYEARQDEEMKKVTDFTNKFEIGKEYTDEDLEEFRKVVTGYTDYTEEFAKNHADRLELKSNQHINRNLAHGSYVNDYVLDSFFDDKKIDKVEYKAYKESIARNSIQPIKDYNDYQSSLIKTSSKALVEEIEGNVQLFKNFKSIQNNEIPVPKEYVPGEQTGLFYNDLESETQEAINAQILKLGEDINLGDKTHTDRHGTSYVDYQHKGLFGVKTPQGGGGGGGDSKEPDIGETPTAGQKVIDQLVASGKVFGEPEIVEGDTVEIYNPGNLKFQNQQGATGKDNRGFAIFSTPEEGWDALYRQIELDKGRDLTLDKFVNKYAPPSENDTTAYRNFLQKELNVGKNTNINKLDTQKLAVAIAKQEGYAGEYPELEDDPKPKAKGLKVDSPLTKVKDGKAVVNYSSANSTGFKRQQANLNKIASQKYNTKENKGKHKNVRDFVKSKFEEWLRSTGKYGKYAEGDFKYFIPTKVDRKNQINSNPDMNLYNLYYPGAFSGAKGNVRMMIKPKIGSGYLGFAKDFDEFRKFLQES